MASATDAAISTARGAVVTALRQRQLVSAAAALEQLTSLGSQMSGSAAERARTQAELGDLWSLLNEYARAEAHYGHAIELAPTLPRYWFNRATVRRFLGQLQAAEEDYDRTLQLAPLDSQAYL